MDASQRSEAEPHAERLRSLRGLIPCSTLCTTLCHQQHLSYPSPSILADSSSGLHPFRLDDSHISLHRDVSPPVNRALLAVGTVRRLYPVVREAAALSTHTLCLLSLCMRMIHRLLPLLDPSCFNPHYFRPQITFKGSTSIFARILAADRPPENKERPGAKNKLRLPVELPRSPIVHRRNPARDRRRPLHKATPPPPSSSPTSNQLSQLDSQLLARSIDSALSTLYHELGLWRMQKPGLNVPTAKLNTGSKNAIRSWLCCANGKVNVAHPDSPINLSDVDPDDDIDACMREEAIQLLNELMTETDSTSRRTARSKAFMEHIRTLRPIGVQMVTFSHPRLTLSHDPPIDAGKRYSASLSPDLPPRRQSRTARCSHGAYRRPRSNDSPRGGPTTSYNTNLRKGPSQRIWTSLFCALFDLLRLPSQCIC